MRGSKDSADCYHGSNIAAACSQSARDDRMVVQRDFHAVHTRSNICNKIRPWLSSWSPEWAKRKTRFLKGEMREEFHLPRLGILSPILIFFYARIQNLDERRGDD